ncbi:MAG: FHA domain-containing protein [Caldilineales bacterium]|nr:FHA domain-containing protein [Caldilineales bacterium]MCW5858321.1 FHA domain-containing protein [Caldilineales bacterium]
MNTNRPAGIVFIVVWLFLNGLSALAATAAPLFALDLFNTVGLSGAVPLLGAVVTLAIAVAYFAMAWGLWELRDWSRLATMILSGIGLVLYLIAAVMFLFGVEVMGIRLSFPGIGIGFLIGAVINGLVIWYLLKPDVQSIYQQGQMNMGGNFATAIGGPPSPMSFPGTETAWPGDWNSSASLPPPTPPSVSSLPTASPAAPVIDATRPLQEPEPVLGWLVVQSGPRAGEQLKLRAGANVVGRDGRASQLLVEESSVSGEHAKIRWENGVFVIYDLASTNGTFVNDRRIEKQRLMDGDKVRMGRMEFTFKQLDPRQRRSA